METISLWRDIYMCVCVDGKKEVIFENYAK